MKFFISKFKKLPDGAKQGLQPRKEFIARGKERFLAAFDASALVEDRQVRTSHLALFFRVGIGAMAAFCIASGVSVYADTANVAPTNPLYPLKRFNESVQLAITPASEKPQLQATFAVRRANEIEALQVTQPTSVLIPTLTTDMDSEISGSLAAGGGATGASSGEQNEAEVHVQATSSATIVSQATPSSSAGALEVYCKTFTMSTSSSVFFGHLESDLVLHPGELAQFNEQCGSDSHGNSTSSNDQSNQATGNGFHYHHTDNSTSTPASSVTTTATTTATTTVIQKGPGGSHGSSSTHTGIHIGL